jgi:carbonic anhydrase
MYAQDDDPNAAPAGMARAAPGRDAGPPPPKPENVLSPDAALARLMAGNERYVRGTATPRNFTRERELLTRGQNPFAGILSCADSRVASEYCFDVGHGDLFVCRVAGNFANAESVASLEYAVHVLATPLIVVVGHEACGAVGATITALTDKTTLPGRMPSLVAAITPAVEDVLGEPGDMYANAVRRNVVRTVETLKTSAPILSAAVAEKRLRIVGGVYALATGKVTLVA